MLTIVVAGESAGSRTRRGPSRSPRAVRCSRCCSAGIRWERFSSTGAFLVEASTFRESTPLSRGEEWIEARMSEPVAVGSIRRGSGKHRLWMPEDSRFGLCDAARMLISRVLEPVLQSLQGRSPRRRCRRTVHPKVVPGEVLGFREVCSGFMSAAEASRRYLVPDHPFRPLGGTEPSSGPHGLPSEPIPRCSSGLPGEPKDPWKGFPVGGRCSGSSYALALHGAGVKAVSVVRHTSVRRATTGAPEVSGIGLGRGQQLFPSLATSAEAVRVP